MKTRTIPELLQVILDNERYFGSYDGLCHLTKTLNRKGKMNTLEENLVINFIKQNAPARYLSDGTKSGYNWEFGEWPPRKEWLGKQIEYSKNFES